jgi:hypothetical protein
VLPRPPSGNWRVAVDTTQPAPADIADPDNERMLADDAIFTGGLQLF